VTTRLQQKLYRPYHRLGLIVLLLLAFALRTYELAAQSLWYDEAISWYLTRMTLPQLTVWTANDIQPPLYYYLLWLWVRLAGTSEFALRFPSVAFAWLTLPLLWRLCRRLFGSAAGWLVLVFGILSPLQVYYAQEARMYTLLTLLGLASSYLLYRIVIRLSPVSPPECDLTVPRAERRFQALAIAYVLTTAAALYTHYFAFFLLVAQGVTVVYWFGRHRPAILRRSRPDMPTDERLRIAGSATRLTWKYGLLIPLALLALYLPWLPYLMSRYQLDASYWPGALKMPEVARDLAITFGLGETVKEQIGVWLAVGYAGLLIIAVVALARAAGDRQRPTRAVGTSARGRIGADGLVFVLIYLVVPVALILALACRTPKFNPRYAMLAWPAFLLILAGGLDALRRAPGEMASRHVGNQFRLRCRQGGFVLGLAFVVATSAYSLSNWYTPYRDNQFNKADFRITASVVRERLSSGEVVLLSSGHMFPAWAYYFGWQGWHALPAIEVLDVNATLDLSVGSRLDELLDGRRGVWLVRWQNETTDPFDVLPLLLGSVGTQDDYGQFWHMELRHYALPSGARFNLTDFVTHPVAATFAGQIRLLGARTGSLFDHRRDGSEGMDIVLVWQALTRPAADYAIFVHLLDQSDQVLAVADHAPARPMREWQPGAVLPDRAQLVVAGDLSDGPYRLEVGLYDASQPGLPRLGPVVAEERDQLLPGERVLIPVTLRAGRFD
jgi:mannosyltransferase